MPTSSMIGYHGRVSVTACATRCSVLRSSYRKRNNLTLRNCQQAPLRRLPSLFRDERQLPSGPGTPPPAQPFLDGMEPDLPATQPPEPDPAMQEELSKLVTGPGNKLRASNTSPEDNAAGI